MKCKCGFENASDARFCGRCRSALLQTEDPDTPMQSVDDRYPATERRGSPPPAILVTIPPPVLPLPDFPPLPELVLPGSPQANTREAIGQRAAELTEYDLAGAAGPDPAEAPLADFPPLPELVLSGPPQATIRVANGQGADEPTEYDPTGSAEPDPAQPLAFPNRPSASSLRNIVLTVVAAGLVLSIAAGAILWLRRPASLPAPISDDKTALFSPSPSQDSKSTGTSAAGRPRLIVEEPTPQKLRIHARSGEKLSFRVRVEDQGLQTGEPQWRLNDDLTAVGPAWTYTAGSGPRVDLVSVAIPGVEVTPRTVVLWYVNVE